MKRQTCADLSQLVFQPMKDNSAQSVIKALKKMFTQMQPLPTYLWGDADTAYLAKETKSMLKEFNVKFYHTFSIIKSSLAELAVKRVIILHFFAFLQAVNGLVFLD